MWDKLDAYAIGIMTFNKWDCLTSFRQFFFIKKNKAFLLKISLKAFSVSD